MVLPSLQVRPSRRGLRGVSVLLSALAVALATVGDAVAFEKWTATRRLEIISAEGVSFRQPTDVAVLPSRFAVLDSINNRIVWFDAGGRHSRNGQGDVPKRR